MVVVLDTLRLVAKHPSRMLVGLNRLYHRRLNTVNANPNGIDVFDEDWDTLVLLDACRYDSFIKCANLPGETEFRYSQGSTSSEFITANFRGKELYDTVYVSANNWYQKLHAEIGAEVFRFIPVERDAAGELSSRPETVTEAALKAHHEHPNKRLIVHYMQPHQPFLGPTGDVIDHEGAAFTTKQANDVSIETWRRAYRENLELVLPHVGTLLKAIDGKTVVSADHGELLGDRQFPVPVRDFGHPNGIYLDELVKVPWHVYQDGRREIIDAGEPYGTEDADMAEVEQHLADLGYRV